MKPIRLFVGAIIITGLALAQPSAPPAAACAQCHDQPQRLSKSTHAGLECQTCHEGVAAYPHQQPVTKTPCAACHDEPVRQFEAGAHARLRQRGNTRTPTCANCHGDVHDAAKARDAAFRRNIPNTCGACHQAISLQYLSSVHGVAVTAGNEAPASCTTCHGSHTNLPPRDPESLVNTRNLRQTCASCHDNVILARRFHLPLDRVSSFDQSFHGLAAKAGSQSVANCASCHGIHNILPPSDPNSTIHPSHLAATCGRCHPGAGERFANAKMHWTERQGSPRGVQLVRSIYLVLIPLLAGLMGLHNGGDFLRKLLRNLRPLAPLPAEPPPPGQLRMTGFERLLHGTVALSFLLLVLSGFALRYPDSWWAGPLVRFESVWPVRGTLHRTAAVLMVAAGLAHVVSLIANSTLRTRWRTLWPSPADVRDGFRMLLYNLGLRRHRPTLPEHSYVAKIEYWAVVWGAAVMALTGFLLWANRYTFAWVPRGWIDVASTLHFYEAVLATVAIVVWHFYTVILDPDVYPMDPAWLTGSGSRRG